MATDLEKLVVSISADVKALERGLARASGVTNNQMRSIERRMATTQATIAKSMANFGKMAVGAFAAGGFATQAQALIDASTRIQNALKVAGLSGEELTSVFDRLFASAQKNAAPLESLVTLYGRASLVQKELGISTEELLRFTDNVGVALRVAGTDAGAASGALLQLSQALGSGTVRAEEFNSILEGALPIAQAAAAGLKEAGGSVARLRALVVDGKLSSEAFFRAFEAGSTTLETKVAGAALTSGQAFERLQNSLIRMAGEFDRVTSVSTGVSGAISAISRAIDGLSTHAGDAKSPLEQMIAPLQKVVDLWTLYAKVTGSITGLDQLEVFKPTDQRSEAAKLLAERLGGTAAAGGTGAENKANNRVASAFAAVVNPVSIADFKPPAGADKKDKKSKASPFERELAQIRERTAAIQTETAAQAGLNPLVNDYGFAVNKASAAHSLLAAAQEAGLKITPELTAQIDQLATGFATASADADKLAESQEKIRQTAEDLKSLGQDALKGFITDLKDGKSGAEALAGALDKIADKLLDMSLNSLFEGLGKGGGGGGFGGLFSGIGKIFGFDQGGYTGNGGKYEPAGVVHKGEYVFSKAAVNKIGAGNLEAMHKAAKGYANGGLVSAPAMPRLGRSGVAAKSAAPPVVINADMRDSSAQAIAVLSQRIDRLQRDLPDMVVQATRGALRNHPYALG